MSAPVMAAPAPGYQPADWTITITDIRIYNIQGGIDPSPQQCAEMYGHVTLKRSGRDQQVWKRDKSNQQEVCEKAQPLNEGASSAGIAPSSAVERTDTFATGYQGKDAPWVLDVQLRDVDDLSADDDVATGAKKIWPHDGGTRGTFNFYYPDGTVKAAIGYDIERETCGRTANDYAGSTYTKKKSDQRESTSTVVFNADGTLTFTVQGSPAIKGTWKVKTTELHQRDYPVSWTYTGRDGKAEFYTFGNPTCTENGDPGHRQLSNRPSKITGVTGLLGENGKPGMSLGQVEFTRNN
ncbi:hypothetical protein ACWDYJ_35350 [Streptomyces sp. NPDC003042]